MVLCHTIVSNHCSRFFKNGVYTSSLLDPKHKSDEDEFVAWLARTLFKDTRVFSTNTIWFFLGLVNTFERCYIPTSAHCTQYVCYIHRCSSAFPGWDVRRFLAWPYPFPTEYFGFTGVPSEIHQGSSGKKLPHFSPKFSDYSCTLQKNC